MGWRIELKVLMVDFKNKRLEFTFDDLSEEKKQRINLVENHLKEAFLISSEIVSHDPTYQRWLANIFQKVILNLKDL